MLQRINDQLQDSTKRLDDANAFLETVLTGLRAGVAVVNRDLTVTAWNGSAENLWGVRPAEAVGQHLLNLDIGLPVDRLRPLLRQVLADGQSQEVALPAINRRGRSIVVRVTYSPLMTKGTDGPVGAILVMESDDEKAPQVDAPIV